MDGSERLDARVASDMSFDADGFFGEEGWELCQPLARAVTAAFLGGFLPILARFGQEDEGRGLDYEPTAWIRPEDRDEVIAELTAAGIPCRTCPDLAKYYWQPPPDLVQRLDRGEYPPSI